MYKNSPVEFVSEAHGWFAFETQLNLKIFIE